MKLHALITTDGFITDFLLTTANTDDRDAVLELIQTNTNSKTPLEKRLRNALSKARRRVETSFSQLAGQFNIARVLAKSKWGGNAENYSKNTYS